ncbi:hypothetical protein MES5069_220118 [Mesorhizobium escarrei]|uniref:Uncharacterized protein n=1 Tax=Mesorhizobium escarrei TaxID=666018 RepID=A0ABM9DRN7_9HYPH|nr:hypothetical protein MES5069_220118 [Mesorhizobium escarrei]
MLKSAATTLSLIDWGPTGRVMRLDSTAPPHPSMPNYQQLSVDAGAGMVRVPVRAQKVGADDNQLCPRPPQTGRVHLQLLELTRIELCGARSGAIAPDNWASRGTVVGHGPPRRVLAGGNGSEPRAAALTRLSSSTYANLRSRALIASSSVPAGPWSPRRIISGEQNPSSN